MVKLAIARPRDGDIDDRDGWFVVAGEDACPSERVGHPGDMQRAAHVQSAAPE